MKIALTPWSVGKNWIASDLCEQAMLAEAMGFHSFWLPENHFGDTRSIPSPLTLLAAVAAKTETIKLGSTSYLLTIRHPLQAAEEVAVLDHLSQGRLILGIGRGVQDTMFRAFDLAVKDKRKQFQKNLDIILNAWQGEPILEDENGEAIYLAPLPLQRPYPPIWLAAFGPLALKQAGKLGLPYLASPVETLGTLKDNYQQHRDVAKEENHPPIQVVPVMRTIFVTSNNSLANRIKAALGELAGHTMRPEGSRVEDWAIIGDPIYVRDKIREYMETLGMTHLIARGRLPDVDSQSQIKSHELLITLASQLIATKSC